MINTNELRLGNYVTDEWNSSRYLVESINVKGIDLEIEDDGNYPECASMWIEATIKSEEIFGIPLTEDLLLKYGFELEDEGGLSAEYCNGCISVVFDAADIALRINSGDSYICVFYDDPAFQHLHQLQNIYFALTGQELQINL